MTWSSAIYRSRLSLSTSIIRISFSSPCSFAFTSSTLLFLSASRSLFSYNIFCLRFSLPSLLSSSSVLHRSSNALSRILSCSAFALYSAYSNYASCALCFTAIISCSRWVCLISKFAIF